MCIIISAVQGSLYAKCGTDLKSVLRNRFEMFMGAMLGGVQGLLYAIWVTDLKSGCTIGLNH